jgi:hypothetical protein
MNSRTLDIELIPSGKDDIFSQVSLPDLDKAPTTAARFAGFNSQRKKRIQ